MAKVQMSVEELIQLARGNMPVEEIKEQLAQGMLNVWNSPETQQLIHIEAERLASEKMQRIIRDSLIKKDGGWGRPAIFEGWAIPMIREILMQNFSVSHVLEAIRPEVDTLVQESVVKALSQVMFIKKEGQ